MIFNFTTPRPKVLFVIHSWGGGTIRFAQELAELIANRVSVIWAWGVDDRAFHISLRGPYISDKRYDLSAGFDEPLRDLRAFRFRRLNIIHTIGLKNHVASMVAALNVPYDVTFTDYHHFSQHPHLADERGHFIEDVMIAEMQRVAREGVPPLLVNADRRIAVSADLAHRMQRFMPSLPITPTRVYEKRSSVSTPVASPKLAAGEVMRILILGRPHPSKGLSVILGVARRIQAERLPVEILCLGETSIELEATLRSFENIRVLGAYNQRDLHAIVAEISPHVAWFPFTVPESHSYALSDVTRLGLPVLATAIGAVPERLIGRALTWLVPYCPLMADDHFLWIKRLYDSRLTLPPAWQEVGELPDAQQDFYPEAYLRPLLQWRWLPAKWRKWSI